VKVVFHSAGLDFECWKRLLQRQLPEIDLVAWPEIGDPRGVRYAIVWQPPPGLLTALHDLEVIFTLSAGVDHVLDQPDLPADLQIARLSDAGMTPQMVEYVICGVLHFHRDFDVYQREQHHRRWQPRPVLESKERTVGVLGLGVIGAAVVDSLVSLGFRVRGWSRSRQTRTGVATYHGPDGLWQMLAACEILICLLPLTATTRGMLNRELFDALPRGACLINCGRGAQLVETDLLEALDTGQLRGALLDVLEPEPLPQHSPLWRHPGVRITPHVAAQTRNEQSVTQIAENICRHEAGQALLNSVDRDLGY